MTSTIGTENVPTTPALVARIVDYAADGVAYLRLAADGAVDWVVTQCDATPFLSMRDANRQATRMPANLRAFGIPRRG